MALFRNRRKEIASRRLHWLLRACAPGTLPSIRAIKEVPTHLGFPWSSARYSQLHLFTSVASRFWFAPSHEPESQSRGEIKEARSELLGFCQNLPRKLGQHREAMKTKPDPRSGQLE